MCAQKFCDNQKRAVPQIRLSAGNNNHTGKHQHFKPQDRPQFLVANQMVHLATIMRNRMIIIPSENKNHSTHILACSKIPDLLFRCELPVRVVAYARCILVWVGGMIETWRMYILVMSESYSDTTLIGNHDDRDSGVRGRGRTVTTGPFSHPQTDATGY